jgi:predicted ATPase
MHVVEPRLQKLRYSKITSQPLVYAHLGFQHFLPATQMGQGFSRLLTLFCEMMVSEAKVLLIDEIENGLHYSVLAEFWKGIGALAEAEDIQVFATTHSWGCIVAAHEAFAAGKDYDFALHRLQRVKGQVEAVTYDCEMLETSLRTELEVR